MTVQHIFMMHLMSRDDFSYFELLGEYLALTGARLNAKEMISAGLATHFVSSEVRHSAASISTSICFPAPMST
jgi:enoyl-CoA hydratase/carnithine racemase